MEAPARLSRCRQSRSVCAMPSCCGDQVVQPRPAAPARSGHGRDDQVGQFVLVVLRFDMHAGFHLSSRFRYLAMQLLYPMCRSRAGVLARTLRQRRTHHDDSGNPAEEEARRRSSAGLEPPRPGRPRDARPAQLRFRTRERYTQGSRRQARRRREPLACPGLERRPAGTAQLLLVVQDIDSPTRAPFVHCVALLEPNLVMLPTGALNAESPVQGVRVLRSGMGRGYLGPEPIKGHGPHRYVFQLFALPTAITSAAGGATLDTAKPAAVLATVERPGPGSRPPRRSLHALTPHRRAHHQRWYLPSRRVQAHLGNNRSSLDSTAVRNVATASRGLRDGRGRLWP